MPLIRDTIDPLNEREVSHEEALDLERQNIVLTGTRAKTPDGLRAAAVRQVLENEAAAFAASQPDRPAVPAEQDDLNDEPVDVTETSGADPVSTTDDTPIPTSTQES